MRVWFVLLLLASLVASSFGQTPRRTRPTPTPYPSLVQITETPGLPRVLLIGDSISMGYTLGVRKRLEGRANVHRPPENCFGSAKGVYHLNTWLRRAHWDVIYFNFGLHDLKYQDAQGRYVTPDQGTQFTPVEAYEANLREIARRLKRSATRVIFATITPIPEGAAGRVKGDEQRYNEAALRVMQESGIEVHDLGEIARARQQEIQLPRDVHFTPAGYEVLAEAVAEKIGQALPVGR